MEEIKWLVMLKNYNIVNMFCKKSNYKEFSLFQWYNTRQNISFDIQYGYASYELGRFLCLSI